MFKHVIRTGGIKNLTNYFVRNVQSKSENHLKFLNENFNLSNGNSKMNFKSCRWKQSTNRFSTNIEKGNFNNESKEFLLYFNDFVQDLTTMTEKKGVGVSVVDHLNTVLQYNVPKGKLNRGLITVSTCKALLNKNQFTEMELKKINCLGWCVEMFQSTLIVLDDIMDHSETRRGDLCWYKNREIGLGAINDGLMIENCIYYLLKKYFGNDAYYTQLVDLFHEIMINTIYGQSIDLSMATKSVTEFSMEIYENLVTYKTSYYSFYFPVMIGLVVTGHTDQKVYDQVKKVLTDIGLYFQIQDDYLDCFGDATITGKIGTDIQDNKCSWLAVKCMEKASDSQKEIMKNCYGKTDPVLVEKVKKLYDELELPQLYQQYETEAFDSIIQMISNESLASVVPLNIFNDILRKIYRRSR